MNTNGWLKGKIVDMNKVALVIIYNHQYNKNIEILENIYKERFSNIHHLVPFYNGTKTNVIPVYDNSFYFQGYVAQGFKSYFREDYNHYIFIADDLLLNPVINENSYKEHLNLRENSCYLPGFITLHEMKKYWARYGEAFRYNVNVSGVEAKNQLPTYEDALKAFKRFGLQINPLSAKQIWGSPSPITSSIKFLIKNLIRDNFYPIRYIYRKIIRKEYNLSYPLVGSYSDIFVVSSVTIKQFCHYCGVFAATNLFVELGLPTAMVLSAEEIITERDLKLQGKALWTETECSILEKYEYQLERLINDFPINYLYLHPIKLSKWGT